MIRQVLILNLRIFLYDLKVQINSNVLPIKLLYILFLSLWLEMKGHLTVPFVNLSSFQSILISYQVFHFHLLCALVIPSCLVSLTISRVGAATSRCSMHISIFYLCRVLSYDYDDLLVHMILFYYMVVGHASLFTSQPLSLRK